MYLGNQGVSSEYLSFFFGPAIISCIQFEFTMTYSIFATRETFFLNLLRFTQQQLQPLKQQTFKQINQTSENIPIQKLSAQNNGRTKREAKTFRRNSMIYQILELAIVVKRHLVHTLICKYN